jgi:hypothetical protein
VRTYETHAHDTQQCGATIDMPSCSVVDIWNEAIRRGAPVNALASIQLDKRLDKSVWRLTISDNGKTVFETSIVDECPIQH